VDEKGGGKQRQKIFVDIILRKETQSLPASYSSIEKAANSFEVIHAYRRMYPDHFGRDNSHATNMRAEGRQ